MSLLKNPAARLLVGALRKEKEYASLQTSLSHYAIPNFHQPAAFVTGLSDTPLALLAASIVDEINEIPAYAGTSILILPDEKTAAYMHTVLSSFMDGVELFPMRDLVFHNVEAFSREWEYARLSVLQRLSEKKVKLILCVPEAALTILPPKSAYGTELTLSVGDSIEIDALLRRLCAFGYTECDTVEGKGQFSHRGDIVDIFPPDEEMPLRLEFFGDELDACGFFDVMTQRRTENVRSFTLSSSRELILDAEQKKLCTDAVDELIARAEKQKKKHEKNGEKLDVMHLSETLEKLRAEKAGIEDGTLPCLDKFLPLLNPERTCLLSYLSGALIVAELPRCLDRLKSAAFQMNETCMSLLSAYELSPDCTEFMREESVLFDLLEKYPSVVTSVFTSRTEIPLSGIYNFVAKSTTAIGKSFDVLCDDVENYNALRYKTILIFRSERAASTFAEQLNDKNIRAIPSSLAGVADLSFDGGAAFCVYDGDFPQSVRGFELSKAGIAILTEGAQSYAPVRKRDGVRKSKKTAGQKILSYQDLHVGDYVVHSVHGIARYEGLKTLTVDGVTRDYIMLQYAGSDALYIPVGQMDRISRYAGAGESVKLSSMSGKDWQKTKAKAKKAAKDMAKKLIDLYAQRARLAGYAFSPDTEWQKEFEEGFEYEETDGQLAAVNDIKDDMEKPHPMDRLLCGDVGFGKTEVALRAVFKCVMDGKQAAILVPTTILCMQHFSTVLSRMKGYPFKIEMLSRFCKPKEAAAVIKRLSTGETDIVVGTHKLLGKNIVFKNLGLLVVDEEQRFGVAHKERLKEISRQIDVLTLSATPIPRTLNMAMAGIRDMSVLEEPPTDRYPVQTYVLEHDDLIILEAIKKELRRGGQVFYLHNRVEGIEETAAKLREKLPDAQIACAHGKMSQEELSDIWTTLVEGEIDILVCTTIIETGVDVPNVNTLIIENAERLGLSQLHQIRGRIGRSNRKAYAYITWRRSAELTEIAAKRLEALREFTEFGSGFKIAMRDLEIRGAGNLLGAEQSGHMEAVGYDLYVRLLEEAVLEEKGILPAPEKDCTIDLRVNAYIPERYIRLPGARIEMYKKIAAAATDADIDDIADELSDRYGEIPKEVIALCRVSLLRSNCIALGIKKLEQREGKLAIYPETIDKTSSVGLALHYAGRLLLAGGQNPCFNLRLAAGEDVLAAAEEFVKTLRTVREEAEKKE